MASKKPLGNDQTSLPFQALQLLAPPVRLVSAALWKVMKDRDVMQYGIVEEFVTSACDTVPGLLTLRHQARLTLGLRARLVFELCRKNPDPKIIALHMKRIRVPVLPSSSLNMERDYKIQSAVQNTHALIPTLLADDSEREHFFKEVFPSMYGTNFDQELEKLLWEFLIRLDQLLPVPSLSKTVSWLRESPPVLEECAQAASQPQLLTILLEHQTCLGHLDPAASLPPNMGEGIITSLSLLPSGKVPSNPQMSLTPIYETPFVKPVIGRISNENVPLMMSIRRRLQSSEMPNVNKDNSKSHTRDKEKPSEVNDDQGEDPGAGGTKRKHIDDCDSASDEENPQRKVRCVKNTATGYLGQTNVTCEAKDLTDNREMLKTCLRKTGYERLPIPNDDFLCSVWISCFKDQPKVVIGKLSLTSAENVDTALSKQRIEAPITPVVCSSVKTQTQRTRSDNKENTPHRPHSQRSALRFKTNMDPQESAAEMEDYVADSEDEATKNFKGRLFTKRYRKTKHGTFIPTLREYWKPCAQRRNLHDPDSKHR